MLVSLPLDHRRNAESFNIPGDSNFPTIQNGDYLFAFSIANHDLRRGDMVTFHLPNRKQTTYIKRIVGLPGEKVQVRGGEVLINDVALRRAEVIAHSARGRSNPRARSFVETTPEGKSYRIYDETPEGPLDFTREQTVPPGHYWVLGDNRDDSLDSRVTTLFGFVPAANIYRKAGFIFWSQEPSRIGLAIE